MKQVFVLALLLAGFKSFCQQKITSQEVAAHLNDSVTVCDKVAGGRFLERAQVTLVYAGAAFPEQPFTIVIRGADRNKFKYKPEDDLKGKRICVTGKVTEYGGKPQIVITDPSQLKIE